MGNGFVFNFRDVASEIVSSEFWEDALRNETLDIATGIRTTPMRKLVKKMPGTYLKRRHDHNIYTIREHHQWCNC